MSPKENKNTSSIDHAGLIFSNVSNAASLYNDEKIVNNPRGHGFAAENANHLYDLYHGRDAEIIGYDNAKNGADRVVDGIQIQTKYCATGSKCISECFDETKVFKYTNADGSPMQIEVPSDKYDDAVQAMRSRIERGQVKNVTNPDEAENIVRRGNFTYEQVKNIAKAGTIESITYDAASGAIIATVSFGLTTVISLATAVWSGKDIDVALKIAVSQGLKVGGVSFVTAVCAGQASKAGLNSFLVGGSEAIVTMMGPKASAVLVNAFRSGASIYGAAAMKSAAKLLRGNAITAAVSFAVLSVADVTRIFRGRISGGQLFKNLTTTASSVAGGTAGWLGGAALGASLGSAVPIIGTAVGGVVGGLAGAFAGGSAASCASKAVLDNFIEDDSKQMLCTIESVFTDLAHDYLINEGEASKILDSLQDALTMTTLQDMYASQEHKMYAKEFLEPYFIKVTSKRKIIALPSYEQMQQSLKLALEDIADGKDPSVDEQELVKASQNDKKKIIEESVIEYFSPLRSRLIDGGCSKDIYIKGLSCKIAEKNFRAAINAYAQGIEKEDIILLIDSTFIKSDEGMIITNSHIYFKNDDTKDRGRIDILSLDHVRIERKFSGNITDLTDTNGKVYHLGNLVGLKDYVERLEQGFDKLLEKIKELRKA